MKTLDDAKRIFQEQLDRLEVDYVDFYLLHCLDKEKWQNVLDLGIIPYMEEMKKEGKIKFFGFSFHDDFETFKTIATYRKWDFCQIQYNYVDTDIQAGDKGYELTEELGIPLVINGAGQRQFSCHFAGRSDRALQRLQTKRQYFLLGASLGGQQTQCQSRIKRYDYNGAGGRQSEHL